MTGCAREALQPWRSTLDNVLLPLEIDEPYRTQFKTKRKECAERASFADLLVVGAMPMAMAMYELFSAIKNRTTGWTHRGSQNT